MVKIDLGNFLEEPRRALKDLADGDTTANGESEPLSPSEMTVRRDATATSPLSAECTFRGGKNA